MVSGILKLKLQFKFTLNTFTEDLKIDLDFFKLWYKLTRIFSGYSYFIITNSTDFIRGYKRNCRMSDEWPKNVLPIVHFIWKPLRKWFYYFLSTDFCLNTIVIWWVITFSATLQHYRGNSHLKDEDMYCIICDVLSLSSSERSLSDQKSNLIWTSIPRPT